MANAKKCDRCGDYYDANTKYEIPSYLNTRHAIGISTLVSCNFSCPTEPGISYDLCDKCLESFYNWLGCENAADD